uniref:inositol-phosphate phosphatase n=1 Tax=Tetranychus urticae TaxID=32264 RepID=T1JW40_TETUR
MYLLVSSYESRTDGPTYVTTRDANIIQKLKALRIIEEPLKFTNYNCYNYKFEYPDICVLDWFQLLGYRVQTMAMTYDPGVALAQPSIHFLLTHIFDFIFSGQTIDLKNLLVTLIRAAERGGKEVVGVMKNRELHSRAKSKDENGKDELLGDLRSHQMMVLQALQLIKGNADAYVHSTSIKKWDICAPNAVLDSVQNSLMTDLKGNTIDHNDTGDVYNRNGLLATYQTNHQKILQAFKNLASSIKHI